MKRLAFAIGFLLMGSALSAGPALGRCTSTDTCLRVLAQAQRDTHTITARFVQTKHLSLLDEALVSTGRFVFKQPDRVLWEVETPHAMSVLVTGNQVSIPGLPNRDRRAMAEGPFPVMFRQLSAIFAGSVEAAKQGFDVTAHEEGTSIRVELVPRDLTTTRMVREIHLGFSGEDLLVHEIRLENALGDSLEISLSEVQRNGDVPDATFDPSSYASTPNE